jgi:hypothetical protein
MLANRLAYLPIQYSGIFDNRVLGYVVRDDKLKSRYERLKPITGDKLFFMIISIFIILSLLSCSANLRKILASLFISIFGLTSGTILTLDDDDRPAFCLALDLSTGLDSCGGLCTRIAYLCHDRFTSRFTPDIAETSSNYENKNI